MELTPDQSRQIWLLHHLYTRWHVKLLAERANYTASLARCVHLRTYGGVSSGMMLVVVMMAVAVWLCDCALP
jgi:hypothetical protein